MPDRWAKVRERLARRTPGQWAVDQVATPVDNRLHIGVRTFGKKALAIALTGWAGDTEFEQSALADADLIANAPTDLQALLDENERLREALGDMVDAFGEIEPSDTEPVVIHDARRALEADDG